MKIHEILEGVGIDRTTGQPTFDFDTDNLEDVIKFFNVPLAHELGDRLFAGFVFTESTAEIERQSNDTDAVNIAKAYKAFKQQHKKVSDKYSGVAVTAADVKEIVQELSMTPAYKSLSRYIDPSELQTIISRNYSNMITASTEITKALAAKYDMSLVMQYVRGEITHQRPAVQTGRLRESYKRAKSAIISAINAGVTNNPEIENFVYFAANRLARFRGLGMRPTVIVRPHTNSELLIQFAEMVAADMGIPVVPGLVKSTRSVQYDGITLVDENGRVNPNLDNVEWIGRGTTQMVAANRIAAQEFRLTHLFPQNRDKITGLFVKSTEFDGNVKRQSRVLLVDDSIFSGTTQREMMSTLGGMGIKNVVSYAILKA